VGRGGGLVTQQTTVYTKITFKIPFTKKKERKRPLLLSSLILLLQSYSEPIRRVPADRLMLFH